MICITLGNKPKPEWWGNFISYTFGDIPRPEDRKVWWQTVDASLKQFGGRLRRNWEGNYFYITFFRESHYAFFVLKFT